MFGNDIIFDATDHTPSSTGYAIYQHANRRFIANRDSSASSPRYIGNASLGIASNVSVVSSKQSAKKIRQHPAGEVNARGSCGALSQCMEEYISDDEESTTFLCKEASFFDANDDDNVGVESSACSSPWHVGGGVGGAADGREWSSSSWSPQAKNRGGSVCEPAWTSEYCSDEGDLRTSVWKEASTGNETDGDGGANDDCRDDGAQSSAPTRAEPCKAAAEGRGGNRSRQGDGGARKAAADGGAGCSRRAGSNQHGDGDGGTATGRGPGQVYRDKIGGRPSPYHLMNGLNNIVKTASAGTDGTCGGEGFSGTFSPKSIWDVLMEVDIEGRNFWDAGCGNGNMLVAALLFKANWAIGHERPVNKGCFYIFEAILKLMEKDNGFLGKFYSERKMDLHGALKNMDLHEVLYFIIGHSIILLAPDFFSCSYRCQNLSPAQTLALRSGVAIKTKQKVMSSK